MEALTNEAEHFPASPINTVLLALDRIRVIDLSKLRLWKAFELRAPVEARDIEHAVQGLVDRNEALRTTIDRAPTPPREVIHPRGWAEVVISDAPSSDVDVQFADTARWIEESVASTTFDISSLPVLKCRIRQLAKDRWLIVLVSYHLFADEWSMTLIEHQLRRALEPDAPPLAKWAVPRLSYSEYLRNRPADASLENALRKVKAIPVLDITAVKTFLIRGRLLTFRDWVIWLAVWLATTELGGRISRASLVAMSAVRRRPPRRAKQPSRVDTRTRSENPGGGRSPVRLVVGALVPAVSDDVRAYAAHMKTTPTAIFAAATLASIHTTLAQDNAVLLNVSGRPSPETFGLVGNLFDYSYVTSVGNAASPFDEIVRAVSEQLWTATGMAGTAALTFTPEECRFGRESMKRALYPKTFCALFEVSASTALGRPQIPAAPAERVQRTSAPTVLESLTAPNHSLCRVFSRLPNLIHVSFSSVNGCVRVYLHFDSRRFSAHGMDALQLNIMEVLANLPVP